MNPETAKARQHLRAVCTEDTEVGERAEAPKAHQEPELCPACPWEPSESVTRGGWGGVARLVLEKHPKTTWSRKWAARSRELGVSGVSSGATIAQGRDGGKLES